MKLFALYFVVFFALLSSGCDTPPSSSSPKPAKPQVELMTTSEALQLFQKFASADPNLKGWTQVEAFYVGPWKGYVDLCERQSLPHTGGFGAETQGLAFIVFRTPFLPQGGGKEDFFIVNVTTKKVTYARGLRGR